MKLVSQNILLVSQALNFNLTKDECVNKCRDKVLVEDAVDLCGHKGRFCKQRIDSICAKRAKCANSSKMIDF